MQDILEEWLQYLRGVWLKRRYILIATWLICPLGWIAVTLMPNQYTSEARVYVDTRSLLQPLLKGVALQTDPTQELALMVKTLLSRANLEQIVRASDADINVTNDVEYEQLLQGLKTEIKVKKTRRENLYTISYQASSPQYVRDIVQAVLDVFVENALGEKRQDSDSANLFLSKQIDEYESRLTEAERRLADFKREYAGLLPGADKNYYSNLDNLQKQLEDTRLAQQELVKRVSSARTQLSAEAALATRQQGAIVTEYDERILNIQTKLDEMLLRYTDRHPDIIELKRLLSGLQKQKRQSLEGISAGALAANSVIYQELKITLNALENEQASLKARESSLQTKLENLQLRLAQVPDVEAKLTGLNRNYQITKDKYEQLLGRREAAQISQNAGKTTDDIKFRVIDPPRVPISPSGPKRPLFVIAVLLGGFGVGFGLSFVFSQISPVVSSPRILYQLTGLPVLGIVSATETSGLERSDKRKTRMFIALNMALLMVFAAVLSINLLPELHFQVIQHLAEIRG